MRFQLFSALALIASVSAVEVNSQQHEVRDVAGQAGPARVVRSFEHPHAAAPRRRRHKRKTCKPKTNSSQAAAEKPAENFVELDTAGSASAASASASPSVEAEAEASKVSSATAESTQAAADPAAKEKSTNKINTSVLEPAKGVTKWTGTEMPSQDPLGSAIATFSTGGGGGPGNSLIDLGGDTAYGSFADMTNEGNNPGLKDAYGKLRVNGNDWTFKYVAGQLNDKDSWFWYTTPDPGNSGLDLTKARTASFTYTVKFQDNFDWKKGGKLPGWYGGDSAEDAKHCSGHAGSPGCFSSRLMWRPDGFGEIYNYYWGSEQPYCKNPATYAIGTGQVVCHEGSGDSLGRNSFQFFAGKPVTVTNTITLNTLNGDSPNADGRQSLIVDGVKVIEANNLIMRHHDEGRFRGLFFSTFFGGSDGSWRNDKDQEATFSDISVSILELF